MSPKIPVQLTAITFFELHPPISVMTFLQQNIFTTHNTLLCACPESFYCAIVHTANYTWKCDSITLKLKQTLWCQIRIKCCTLQSNKYPHGRGPTEINHTHCNICLFVCRNRSNIVFSTFKYCSMCLLVLSFNLHNLAFLVSTKMLSVHSNFSSNPKCYFIVTILNWLHLFNLPIINIQDIVSLYLNL